MNIRKYGVFCSVIAILLTVAVGLTVLSPVSVYATSETSSEDAYVETSTEVESTAEPPTTTPSETTTEVESTAEPPTTTPSETTTEVESTAEPPTTTPSETSTEVESTTEEPTVEIPTIGAPAVDDEPVLDNEYGVIQNKIDRMLDMLGVQEGKTVYFTVNQSACSSWRKNGHGCSKCDIENIVAAEWFKKIFGEIDTGHFPPHSGTAMFKTNTGRSCFGFACFAQWYALAENTAEKFDGECVAIIKFNKEEIMNNVKPGDVLRVNDSHSMLVYSVEEEGVVVVDSNWNVGGQLNCVVQKHMILYDSSYKGDVTCVNRAVKIEDEAVGRWIQTDDGKWYYIDSNSGNILTGWVGSEESGLWYYMDPSAGYMLSDCWLCDPDSWRWYYLDVNGAMCTSWIVVDDIWYYLDVNGAMCTGWNIINDKWYFFGANGAMLTGWQEIDGKFYYMTENGDCLINTTTPDGYKVDENGARIDEDIT